MTPAAKKPPPKGAESGATYKEPFVQLLRRHRVAQGLTQAALAKKMGVVPSAVSFWESGQSLPSPRHVPKLARILGLDAMTLTRVIQPDATPVAAT